jgi:hypothetical protein
MRMSAVVDIRSAVREANRVLSRFPARSCLPMVLLGSAIYLAAAVHPSQIGSWFSYLVDLVASLLYWLAEIVVAGMFLHASYAETTEVMRYPGLPSVVVGIAFRWAVNVMAYGLVGFLISAIILVAWVTAWSVLWHIGVGIGFKPYVHWLGNQDSMWFGLMIGAWLFIFVLALRRYIFVCPMFVIAKGARPGFFKQCVLKTKRVWRQALLLSVLTIATTLIPSMVRLAVWRRLGQPPGMGKIVDLPIVFVVECLLAWFVLLKTGLALQLMNAPPLAEPEGDGTILDSSQRQVKCGDSSLRSE